MDKVQNHIYRQLISHRHEANRGVQDMQLKISMELFLLICATSSLELHGNTRTTRRGSVSNTCSGRGEARNALHFLEITWLEVEAERICVGTIDNFEFHVEGLDDKA